MKLDNNLVDKLLADYDRQRGRKQLFILDEGDPSRYHDTICLQEGTQAGEWNLVVNCLAPGKSVNCQKKVMIKDRDELKAFLSKYISEELPNGIE